MQLWSTIPLRIVRSNGLIKHLASDSGERSQKSNDESCSLGAPTHGAIRKAAAAASTEGVG